jgi:hypothetical protein
MHTCKDETAAHASKYAAPPGSTVLYLYVPFVSQFQNYLDLKEQAYCYMILNWSHDFNAFSEM